MVEHLTNLLDETEIVPAVNQIELHPYFQQPQVQAFNAEHGIVTQAWSPIGGITFYREGEHTSTLEDPAIVKIAESHSKSPAQVMLRWHLQEGRSVIPKSTKPRRIAENFDVFDFELTGALINNAGVMLLGPFESDQRADYRQMIEVNLLGAITVTEVFLDQLKDGGGDIINISSVAGRTARSGNGVYAATKWGINGWSESLRQELLPDVRVTLVEPGVVATELPNHITHADTKQGVQQLYDKAEVTAEDVAEIIAFILSRPCRLAINEILLRPAGQQ